MSNKVEIEISAKGAQDASRELDLIERSAQELGESYKDMTVDLEMASKSFAQSQKNIAAGVDITGRKISSTGQTTSKELSRIDDAFARAADSWKNFSRIDFSATFNKIKVGAVAVGAVATASMVAGAKASIEFGRSLALTSTMLDLSVEDMQRMGDQLDELAISLGKTPEEMAAGFFKIVSQGTAAGDAISGLTSAGRSAVAMGADLTTTLDLTTNTAKAMGISIADSAMEISDLGLAAAKLGDFLARDFAAAFVQPVSFANSLGLSMQQIAAIFTATVGPLGEVNNVATLTKALFTQLLSPTEKLKETIKAMGFDSAKSAIQSLGLQGALAEMSKTAERLGYSFSEVMGSSEAFRAANAIGIASAAEYNDELQQLQNSAGMTDQAFTKMTEGVGKTAFAVDQTKAALEVFNKRVFETALGTDTLGGSVGNLRDLFSDPEFAASIGRLVSMLANLLTTASDAITAFGRLKGMQKELSASYQTQADDARKAFDRTREALAQAGISYDEFRKKIEASSFAPLIQEQAKAFEEARKKVEAVSNAVNKGLASQSMLREEIEKMNAAEAALASTRAEAARSLILQNEQYGISEATAKKAQEALRGMIPVQEKSKSAAKENAAVVAQETEIVKAKTAAVTDSATKHEDITKVIQENAEAADFLNKTYGTSIKVISDETQEIESITKAIQQMTGQSKEVSGQMAKAFLDSKAAIDKERQAVEKQTEAYRQYGDIIAYINNVLGVSLPIYDEKEKRVQELTGAISDLQIAEKDQARYIAESIVATENAAEKEKVRAQGIEELSQMLGGDAKLIKIVNQLTGDGNRIMTEEQKVRAKLISILHDQMQISQELSEEIADQVLSYAKLRNSIIDVMGSLSQAIGVLEEFDLVSGDAASGLSSLVDGFGQMVSGDMVGGAITVLTNFKSIARGLGEVLGYTSKEIISMSEAAAQAGGILEHFGMQSENASKVLTNLIYTLLNSGKSLSDLNVEVDKYIEAMRKMQEESGKAVSSTDLLTSSYWSQKLGLDDLQENIDAYEEALRRLVALDPEAIGDIFSEDLGSIPDIFANVSRNIEQWENRMEIANDTLAALMKSGMSLSEVMQAMGDTFTASKSDLEQLIFASMKGDELEKFRESYGGTVEELVKKAKELGININADLINLLELQEKLAKNENIISSIDAVSEALKNMIEAGQFGQPGGGDSLSNYLDEVRAQMENLKKAGFDNNEILIALGPVLGQLEEAAKQAGVQLDEDIQKMVDAAAQAGVLGEADPMKTMSDTMSAIYDLLAAAFPAAAAKTQQALQDVNDQLVALGDVKIPPLEIPPIEFPAPKFPDVPNIPVPPQLDDILSDNMPKTGKSKAPSVTNIIFQNGAVSSSVQISGAGLSAEGIVEAIQRNKDGIADAMAKAVTQREK